MTNRKASILPETTNKNMYKEKERAKGSKEHKAIKKA
jgi:hypothetical protein